MVLKQSRALLGIRKLFLFIIWNIYINDQVELSTTGIAGKL